MHVGRRTQAEVVHGHCRMQATRGVSGRANVRICVASSYGVFRGSVPRRAGEFEGRRRQASVAGRRAAVLDAAGTERRDGNARSASAGVWNVELQHHRAALEVAVVRLCRAAGPHLLAREDAAAAGAQRGLDGHRAGTLLAAARRSGRTTRRLQRGYDFHRPLLASLFGRKICQGVFQ